MRTDVYGRPVAQGLYNPELEKDACGVGYVVSIDGVRSHKVGEKLQTDLFILFVVISRQVNSFIAIKAN